MSVKDDNFPASSNFDELNQVLAADDAERRDIVKKAKTVFAFILTNADGKEQSWYLDLKNKGIVAKGAAPAGLKTDVTLILSDNDFGALANGKANPQRLFMSGRLKVKGNIMAATKIDPILKKAQARAKL